jgi:hypothetical protein
VSLPVDAGGLFLAASQPTSSAKVHDWPGGDSIAGAIFIAVILDDQQIGNKFGLSRNNNRLSHSCGYAGACERITAVQQGGTASRGLWSTGLPATALLRRLYAAPLLRRLCL